MESHSDPSHESRKTLADIRRELDAEFGAIETIEAPIAERDARPDQHSRAPRGDRKSRRLGYLLAGLVGCVAGQLLLLAILIVLQYGRQPESGTPLLDPSAGVPSIPSPTVELPAAPPQRPVEPPAEPPSSVVGETPVATPPPAAIVAAATVAPEESSARPAPEPRVSSVRPKAVTDGDAAAQAQVRLRLALKRWLSDASVQATDPVILLGADARTARIRLSVVSPIGLIPREQRWELGPRGWSLLDDRQAGLPVPGTAPMARDR